MILRAEGLAETVGRAKDTYRQNPGTVRKILGVWAASALIAGLGSISHIHPEDRETTVAAACADTDIECFVQAADPPIDVPAATIPAPAVTEAPATTAEPTTTAPAPPPPPPPTTAAPQPHTLRLAGIDLNISLSAGGDGLMRGIDMSFPPSNCAVNSLPPGLSFAILGVDHGHNATSQDPSQNDCLVHELQVVLNAGITNIQLYANTDYPGMPGAIEAYPELAQACGTQPESEGCVAREYGRRAGQASYNYAHSVGIDSSAWWMDVETANKWSPNLEANALSIEGKMQGITEAARQAGINNPTFGIYSAKGIRSSMMQRIVGSDTRFDLPSWEANGLGSEEAALTRCQGFEFTTGRTMMVQWGNGGLDQNIMCP